MEDGELFGNRLLDTPASSVAAQESGERAVEVVGKQQRGTAARFGTARNGDWAQLAVIAAKLRASWAPTRRCCNSDSLADNAGLFSDCMILAGETHSWSVKNL